MVSRDSAATKSNETIKFLYSYGGVIRPRRTDGKLRYVGGHNRVLSVDRSISFSELDSKFVELCGSSMVLKCKLPNEDLDVLVTVTSDEDLRNVIDEYVRFSKDVKITAVLSPRDSVKTMSPVSSSDDLCSISSGSSGNSASSSATAPPNRFSGLRSSQPHTPATAACRCCGQIPSAARVQIDAAGRYRFNPEQMRPPRPLNRLGKRVASADDLYAISSGSTTSPSYAAAGYGSAHPQMRSSSSYSRLSTLGNQNDGVRARLGRTVSPCRGQGNPRPVHAAPSYFNRCH